MNLTNLTRTPIESPSALMQVARQYEHQSDKHSRLMLFRGQPRCFENLMPTLGRAVSAGDYDAATLLEKRLIGSFRTHYGDLISLPSDMPTKDEVHTMGAVDLLSLMQHYEVPSRLLDWSESIWVAAYFACASDLQHDAELWMMDPELLMRDPDETCTGGVRASVEGSIGLPLREFDKKWGMPYLAIVEPKSNARLMAQKGRLSACENAMSDHAQLLWRLATDQHGPDKSGSSFTRHVIKASRKPDILRLLAEEKGVSAKTLFPDIVGLGRFLRWEFEALRTSLY